MEENAARESPLPDDLSRKLEQFLSDPASMNKLQSALSAFTQEDAPPPAPVSAPLPEMSLITKLAPLLSGLGHDDQSTVLLKALRPYVSGEREKRLDEAIHMMRLLNLLPLLNDQQGGAG